MTARNECACFIHLIVAAAQHIVDGLLRHIGRDSHNVQCQLRLTAHGVHIGEGVGGGNGAESVGIVGDRGEEVHRLHQCQIVADAVHAGIIALIKTHQQIGITVDADALQQLCQYASAYFCAASCAGGKFCQFYFIFHLLPSQHMTEMENCFQYTAADG